MLSSRTLSHFISDLAWEAVPAATLDNARGRILDFFSSAAAGYRVNAPMNAVMLKTLHETDAMRQSGVLFTADDRLSMAGAAAANAFLGHGADLDDGHMLSSGHPGVCVIPAALSVAQALELSAKDALLAIIVGYEVYVRLSNTIMPSHLHRGFHGTGTVGAVACAAAAAKLMDLPEELIHRAISLGANAASGLFEVSESGQGIKPINPANAARNGIFAALLAKNGAEAPENPFEGNRGFFKAFSDQQKMDEITNALGEKFSIDSCYIKQYPACRHTHGVIDCAVALHDEGGFALNDIVAIRLYSYENAVKTTGSIMEPQNTGEAKFSQAYGAAVGLTTGGYTLRDLEAPDAMPDPVRSLIRKTTVCCEPGLEVRSKMMRGARVEMDLKGGRTLSKAVVVPKGEAATPLTREDRLKKLRSCAEGVYTEGRQNKIFNACYAFGGEVETDALLSLLGRPDVSKPE